MSIPKTCLDELSKRGTSTQVDPVDSQVIAYLAGIQRVFPQTIEENSNAALPSEEGAYPVPLPSAPPLAEGAYPVPPPAEKEENRSFDQREIKRSNWSSYRIKRAALYTLSGMTIAASVGSFVTVAIGVLPPIGLIAGIGLSIIGAGFLERGISIVDYHNQNELEKLREKMRSTPLQEVVAQHTWRRIFKYSILFPQDVYAKFCEMAQDLSIPRIIKAYEKAFDAYSALQNTGENQYVYTLPHPTLWLWKFQEEISEMNVGQFLQNYQLDTLNKYGFLSLGAYKELKELKSVYSEEVNTHYKQIAAVKALYHEQISQIEKQKKDAILRVKREYDNQSCVVRLKNLDTEFEAREASALRGVNEKIEAAFDRFSSFKEGLLAGFPEDMLDNNQRNMLCSKEIEYEALYEGAQREAAHIRSTIKEEKNRVKRALKKETQLLYEKKRLQMEQIATKARQQIIALETVRNKEIETTSAPYRSRIESINNQFTSILRHYNILL